MNPSEIIRWVLLAGLAVVGYLLIRAWSADHPQVVPVSEQRAPLPDTERFVVPEMPSKDEGDTDIPDSSLVRSDRSVTTTATTSIPERLIHVVTPLQHVWIDPVGGDIAGLQLPKFAVSLEQPDVPLKLLDRSEDSTYVAQSGLLGRDGPDGRNEGRPKFRTDRYSYVLREGQRPIEVVLHHDQGGVSIRKIYRFRPDEYLIDVVYEIDNRSNDEFVSALWVQLKRDGKRANTQTASNWGPRSFLGVALTTDETNYEKQDFEDLDDERLRENKEGGWIAIIQRYFLAAWVSQTDKQNRYFAEPMGSGMYRAGFVGPEIGIAPNAFGTYEAQLYAGPKNQRKLGAIATHLDRTLDYGWLWFLSEPLFLFVDWIFGLVGNWGLAIILLTIVVKIALFPLMARSYKSMAKMRKVAPQLKRLQERYADDKQKLSQEMMGLYKKEGANPLGGCLPMLMQMPVFFALYWVLYESVELRHAPFIGWINDLSAMDPLFVLPILMGASQYGMQMMNPPMPDPMQQQMMRIMPLFFCVIMAFFPAGLVLYWVVNNLFSFAQQFYATRKYGTARGSFGSSGTT
ncbi:MAG: membrane protein insertase YidC [Pseudomonadota bacterium]|nr:membrane protein insertase YidC [Pseudomonadota bacterium]HBP14794.1 membrane protein insertase YidC [Gammaproteobacteria bacterium]HCP49379.1 membrane protein insertase YidC [Gammaproteobacteria bacterium]